MGRFRTDTNERRGLSDSMCSASLTNTPWERFTAEWGNRRKNWSSLEMGSEDPFPEGNLQWRL